MDAPARAEGPVTVVMFVHVPPENLHVSLSALVSLPGVVGFTGVPPKRTVYRSAGKASYAMEAAIRGEGPLALVMFVQAPFENFHVSLKSRPVESKPPKRIT